MYVKMIDVVDTNRLMMMMMMMNAATSLKMLHAVKYILQLLTVFDDFAGTDEASLYHTCTMSVISTRVKMYNNNNRIYKAPFAIRFRDA